MRLSVFHPFIELAAFAVALWAGAMTIGTVLVFTCLLGWLLLALAIIDWRHFLLPDALTFPLLLIGFAASWVIDPTGLMDRIIAVALGFAVFAAIAFVYRRLRGREGLGWGDAKLLAALGAWVSWIGLPSVVLYAAVSGLALTLAVRLIGRVAHGESKIPFGTFLALGGWLIWLYGPLVPL